MSKRKHDKESRLETVLAGREGREKYGRGHRQKLNPFASTTNKEGFITEIKYTKYSNFT